MPLLLAIFVLGMFHMPLSALHDKYEAAGYIRSCTCQGMRYKALGHMKIDGSLV